MRNECQHQNPNTPKQAALVSQVIFAIIAGLLAAALILIRRLL